MKALPQECEEAEDWLVTYADAITLLMCFFVMLVSFSKVDLELYDEVMSGISEEIGKLTPGKVTDDLKQEIEDFVFAQQLENVVTVTKNDRGLTLSLKTANFFRPGTADLAPVATPALAAIGQILNADKYTEYMVEVEGHTDSAPIKTARFPSNWELAAGRSSTVVRNFLETSLWKKRFTAISYGPTRPKVPNVDEMGEPLPVNMAINRRIEINIVRMSLDQKAEFRATMAKLEAEAARKAAEERARAEQERIHNLTQGLESQVRQPQATDPVFAPEIQTPGPVPDQAPDQPQTLPPGPTQ